MKTLFLCGILLSSIGIVYGDDVTAPSKQGPVSIKIVQPADAKGDAVQIQVINSSTNVIVVDREALQQPDFTVSKDVTAKDSDDVSELIGGSARGSVGGRWTLAQLQRREPNRLATIQPGKTFTLDVEIAKLLGSAHESFRHGDIKLGCSFHDFLLAVDGKDTTENVFKARVEAKRSTIHWQ